MPTLDEFAVIKMVFDLKVVLIAQLNNTTSPKERDMLGSRIMTLHDVENSLIHSHNSNLTSIYALV